jgi:hypothetical protein
LRLWQYIWTPFGAQHQPSVMFAAFSEPVQLSVEPLPTDRAPIDHRLALLEVERLLFADRVGRFGGLVGHFVASFASTIFTIPVIL